MKLTKKLKNEISSQARNQARIKRQIDKQIEAGIDEYRAWTADQLDKSQKPITIIAEGDSWFNYSLAGKDVIDKLERLMSIKINNLASPGDEAAEMLTGEQKERLERELKRGPAYKKRKKYDFFLFSGGGNDLVGKKTFYLWFHDYKKGMQPKDILNTQAIGRAFGMLEVNYKVLFGIRDNYSPETVIFLNTYDFAIPDGRGVCFKGPWLQPGLKHRKVPVGMRTKVVELFLKEYETFISKLAIKNKNIIVVPTQGTLTKNDWANELHPTNPGFNEIAKVFEQSIKNQI